MQNDNSLQIHAFVVNQITVFLTKVNEKANIKCCFLKDFCKSNMVVSKVF
jgi:hypothetical protein